MKKTIIIIDTKLVSYYLWHRKQDIVGSMQLVAKLGLDLLSSSEFGNIIPIFVMDKGQSKRAKFFPEYKAHRKDLIKKQGEAYINKQKQLEKDYQKMEELFRCYGRTLNINGLEADDLASIISSIVNVDNVVFATSDSDWVKFMQDISINVGNYYMLHINRQKLISIYDLEKEFGIPNYYYKYVKDVFCGVKKENVSGVIGLGDKKFKKFTNNGSIIGFKTLMEIFQEQIDKGSLKLPEDVSSLEDLVSRNRQIFEVMTFKSLDEEEQAEFKKQWSEKPSKSIEEIIEVSSKIFGRPYLPTAEEKFFYKLS